MGDNTNGHSNTNLSPEVLRAIYGTVEDKKAAYEESLRRWWNEYADRKNDEEHEYVANSLLYDRNHLPRTAPAPDCCAPAGGNTSNSAAAGDSDRSAVGAPATLQMESNGAAT